MGLLQENEIICDFANHGMTYMLCKKFPYNEGTFLFSPGNFLTPSVLDFCKIKLERSSSTNWTFTDCGAYKNQLIFAGSKFSYSNLIFQT
jgi:hypothetical protein